MDPPLIKIYYNKIILKSQGNTNIFYCHQSFANWKFKVFDYLHDILLANASKVKLAFQSCLFNLS